MLTETIYARKPDTLEDRNRSSPVVTTPLTLRPAPVPEVLSSSTSELQRMPKGVEDEILPTPKPRPAPSIKPAYPSPLPPPSPVTAWGSALFPISRGPPSLEPPPEIEDPLPSMPVCPDPDIVVDGWGGARKKKKKGSCLPPLDG